MQDPRVEQGCEDTTKSEITDQNFDHCDTNVTLSDAPPPLTQFSTQSLLHQLLLMAEIDHIILFSGPGNL